MNITCIINWKTIMALGISASAVILSSKVKSEDAPAALTNMIGNPKNAIEEIKE